MAILEDGAMFYKKRQIVLGRELASCSIPLSLLEAAHEAARYFQGKTGWLVPVRVVGYGLAFAGPFASAITALLGMGWWFVFSSLSAAGVLLAVFPEVDAWKRAAAVENIVREQDAWAAEWTKKYVRAASIGKFTLPLLICAAAHFGGFLAASMLFSLLSVSAPAILRGSAFAPLFIFLTSPWGFLHFGAAGYTFSYLAADFPPSLCNYPALRLSGWGFGIGGIVLGWAVLVFVLAAAALAILF